MVLEIPHAPSTRFSDPSHMEFGHSPFACDLHTSFPVPSVLPPETFQPATFAIDRRASKVERGGLSDLANVQFY